MDKKKKFALEIVKTLRKNKFQAYFAGGCVRDMVMGKTPEDYDITTDARPNQIKKLFKKTVFVGAQFGTVLVVKNGIPLEVTTFRSKRRSEFSKDPKEEFVFLSIHHTAFKNSWNSANGASCHIYPNSKSGKKIGDILQKEIVKSTGLKNRGVKESNFFVLRKTVCPAVLSENGFMTNLDDATFGMSEEGSKKIAEGHFNAIKLIENEKK